KAPAGLRSGASPAGVPGSRAANPADFPLPSSCLFHAAVTRSSRPGVTLTAPPAPCLAGVRPPSERQRRLTMTSLSRLAAWGLVAAGLTAVAVSFRPDWAADLGVDVWNVPAIQEQIARNLREQEALDRQGEAVHRRIEAKREIVTDLAAERLTLREAAARFRELNALPPDSLRHVRTSYPGA